MNCSSGEHQFLTVAAKSIVCEFATTKSELLGFEASKILSQTPLQART